MVAGQTISHYDVLNKLGEGGMGVVYKAIDSRLHRTVALKLLAPQFASSPDQLTRFREEAQAISTLNHPNIETIYEIDEDKEGTFLVLEYLPGGTVSDSLKALAAEGRLLPIGAVIDCAIQIADGLAHAHEHGVVHRDIKTGNLMLTENGSVKITDFGLARLAAAKDAGDSGTVAGTPPYMAPELASLLPADQRSDVFSFGVVLFELITNRVPFEAPTPAETLWQIVHQPAPDIRQFRPGVPPGLESIVRRALQKSPADRYQSMREALSELQALQRTLKSDTIGVPALRQSRVRAGVLISAIVAGVFCLGSVPDRRASLPPEKRVVVLPFNCMPRNPENQAFCDGLVDSLTTQIGGLQQYDPSVWVVPAAERRGSAALDGQKVARKAGATLALAGAVWRSDDHVSISATLFDSAGFRTIRSFHDQFPTGQVEAMQSALGTHMASMLGLNLSPRAQQELGPGATPIASAYELYLHGLGYLRGRRHKADYDRAIEAFQQALDRDPKYALAYGGLAETYVAKQIRTGDTQLLEMGEMSIRLALALNDNLAPIHSTAGMICKRRGKYEEAAAHLRRALEIEPLNADAMRRLAATYEAQGDMDGAEEAYRKAVKLRPNYYASYVNLGVFLRNQGKLAAAEPCFRKAVELNGENTENWSALGSFYMESNRYKEAEETFLKSLSIEQTPLVSKSLGILYDHQGRYPEATRYFKMAAVLAPGKYEYWGNLADAYRLTPDKSSEAQEAYVKATRLAEEELGLNRKNALLRSQMAFYLAQMHDRDRALIEIRRALNDDPHTPDVRYWAALVYETTGDRDRAVDLIVALIKGGYSLEVICKERDLAQLRTDSRLAPLLPR